jgi:hypothetical protein
MNTKMEYLWNYFDRGKGKLDVLGEKPVQVPPCPSQIPPRTELGIKSGLPK